LAKAKYRFHREAKMLATLGSHSQIPMLINYFVVNDDFYLVQEYIEGQTLSQYIRHRGLMTEAQVKSFLIDMLYLLQYVHNNQVIHRDIKPQNIIRAKLDRRLILIDFGAVKEVATINTDTAKGLTTQFIGTVGFAPPEQFALRPTYASDIYALGVTCLFLLTGKSPSEMRRDTVKGQILWQEYVKISDNLGQILDRMIKVSLQERYHSANEVLQAINPQFKQINLADCLTNTPLVKTKVAQNTLYPKKEEKSNPLEQSKIFLRKLQERIMRKKNDSL
jgi:serine/threonine protein kinase